MAEGRPLEVTHMDRREALPPAEAGGPSEQEVAADPVLELLGWHAEPRLLSRLKFYVAESAVELATLAVGMTVGGSVRSPPGLFVRLLCLPLVIVSIRLAWAARLACSYHCLKDTDVATLLRRMRRVDSRECWSCSVAFFTCFSCVLMVWHGILVLLLFGYQSKPGEPLAVQMLTILCVAFMFTNWAFWKDFVHPSHTTADLTHGNDRRLRHLWKIYELYKSRTIRVQKHRELAEQHDTVDCSKCTVCMEDYLPEELVAQLPCGHVFHPTCFNKWACRDWRCPLRCALEPSHQEQAKEMAIGRQDLEAGSGQSHPEAEGDQQQPA